MTAPLGSIRISSIQSCFLSLQIFMVSFHLHCTTHWGRFCLRTDAQTDPFLGSSPQQKAGGTLNQPPLPVTGLLRAGRAPLTDPLLNPTRASGPRSTPPPLCAIPPRPAAGLRTALRSRLVTFQSVEQVLLFSLHGGQNHARTS